MTHRMHASRSVRVAVIFRIFVSLATVPRCSAVDLVCATATCAERHASSVSLLQTSLGFEQPLQQQQPMNASGGDSSEFAVRAQLTLNHSVLDVVKLKDHGAETTALRHLHGGDGELNQTRLESARVALNQTISESELITGAYEALEAITEQRAAHQQAEQSHTSTEGVGTGGVVAMIIAVPCLIFLIIGVITRMNQGGSEGDLDPFMQKPPAWPSPPVQRSHESLPSSTSPILPTSKVPRGGRPPAQTGAYPGRFAQPDPATSGSLQPRSVGDGQMLPPTVGTVMVPSSAVCVPLPPICPSLMLPRTEARFLVSMSELMQINVGSLEIKGTSGRPLLRATLTLTPQETRHFAMASMGCEDDPRTIVVGNSMNRTSPLEVYGRGGQLYGMLQPGEMTSVLHYQGQPVMKIDCGPPHEFCMSASTMDGSPLGVGRGGPAGGGDHWKLTVKPNQDAVLIASCMLSLILLGKQ